MLTTSFYLYKAIQSEKTDDDASKLKYGLLILQSAVFLYKLK